MYCSKCGKELPDGSTFCNECGVKQSDDLGANENSSQGNSPNPPASAPKGLFKKSPVKTVFAILGWLVGFLYYHIQVPVSTSWLLLFSGIFGTSFFYLIMNDPRIVTTNEDIAGVKPLAILISFFPFIIIFATILVMIAIDTTRLY